MFSESHLTVQFGDLVVEGKILVEAGVAVRLTEQSLHRVVEFSKLREFCKKSAIRNVNGELNRLIEVEVDIRRLVAGQVSIRAHVIEKGWQVLLARGRDLHHIARYVTRHRDGHLELDALVAQHADVAAVLRVFAEELRLPLVSDVGVNGHALGHFEVTINEIGQVWELEAERELHIEPGIATIVGSFALLVLSVLIFDTAVLQLMTDSTGEAANLPVTKCGLH